LVVDAAGLVALGGGDVQPPRVDGLLALRCAQLLEARQALAEALLVLLRGPLGLPAGLPPRRDGPGAGGPRVPLRRLLALLEGRLRGLVLALGLDVGLLGLLVGLPPGGQLAVARDRALHQHGELELRQAALVLRAALVQLAGDVVVALPVLAPAAQALVVAHPHRLELGALAGDRPRVAGLAGRPLHVILNAAGARRRRVL